MLICVMLRLICSQPSITLSSLILRSTSAGSSAANIAAGFGNGIPPGTLAVGSGAPKPGIGMPNGFHIFCMNAIASCGENGGVPPGGGFVVSALIVLLRGLFRSGGGASFAIISCAMGDHGATLLSRLTAAVGESNVLTAPPDTEPYLVDWRGRYRGAARAVVRPSSTEEVAAVVRICGEEGAAIVPQGGNTSMCGGATPRSVDEVVVSLARMNRIRAIDVDNTTITVEAGATLVGVQQAAAEAGLFFPLSLAAEGSCTIGGNLSTNAGGTAVLRFGNARDLALGIEVVLADGRVWNGLRGLRKDNTGYDLKQLFIGGEGTLGIVTAMVLKLYAAPRARVTAFAAVSDVEHAVALLRHAKQAVGDRLTGFELVSDFALSLSRKHHPGLPDPLPGHPWYALLQVDDSVVESSLVSLVEDALAAAVESALALDATVAQTEDQAG